LGIRATPTRLSSEPSRKTRSNPSFSKPRQIRVPHSAPLPVSCRSLSFAPSPGEARTARPPAPRGKVPRAIHGGLPAPGSSISHFRQRFVDVDPVGGGKSYLQLKIYRRPFRRQQPWGAAAVLVGASGIPPCEPAAEGADTGPRELAAEGPAQIRVCRAALPAPLWTTCLLFCFVLHWTTCLLLCFAY
jgi:hypothetical protein